MSNERFERGWQKLMEVDGEGGERVINSLKDIAPDLGKYIIEFAFGDIYSREVLDLKQRQLVTISSLTTQGGCEPQLTVHINAALNVGLTPNEIVEAIMHCAPYTGFPRVINSIFVAKQIFEERKLNLD
jgi:4-carboxymuconolactone decarboxylase